MLRSAMFYPRMSAPIKMGLTISNKREGKGQFHPLAQSNSAELRYAIHCGLKLCWLLPLYLCTETSFI